LLGFVLCFLLCFTLDALLVDGARAIGYDFR
jgi:hypothetical protein